MPPIAEGFAVSVFAQPVTGQTVMVVREVMRGGTGVMSLPIVMLVWTVIVVVEGSVVVKRGGEGMGAGGDGGGV